MQINIERARKKRRRKRDLLRLLLEARMMFAKSLRYLWMRKRTRPGFWLWLVGMNWGCRKYRLDEWDAYSSSMLRRGRLPVAR